ncbi:hypothetical protein [Paraliobacillus ryukyuensis]|uniref:hypothetical protein n=1 Tax=Paraliobacillus ryukyuensis TaxID=200904 RepID=UPI0009A6EE6E|nr:hypothetical protein [Paraliobacillus ryukyuensis]
MTKDKLNVVEYFCEGKKGDLDLCEDMCVVTDNFAAVIDGATNVSGKLIENMTPGRLAATIIKETLENITPSAKLETIVEQINANFQTVFARNNLIDAIQESQWVAPSASVIIYSKYHQKIWQIGDCQLMVDDELYTNEKEIDSITANARALYLEAELKRGKTIDQLIYRDTGWEYIRTLVQQQYFLQNDSNNPFGYSVINGFPVDFSRVMTIDVSTDAKYIVLASDGYPFLKETLYKSESLLKELLVKDPLCFRLYKSSKGLVRGNQSFDDRLYLKIKV